MKKKEILSSIVLVFVLFLIISCNKKITNEQKSKDGVKLEFSIGDLLAQTHVLLGEKTLWVFEYKSFPVVILNDIEKDGRNYILVLENGLTGAKTKVSVKKGTIIDVKESLPLDTNVFGTYEAITKARGHIPNEMKVIEISKTKLVVEVTPK